jgi:hypothetical protein
MYVAWGGNFFQSNGVDFQIAKEALRTQGGYYYGQRERWTCTVDLIAALTNTQAQITSYLQAVETAFSYDGGDLVFYLDDGVTPTAHALYNADCIGGTRVIEAPSFPTGRGGQYVPGFGRTFTFSVEGVVSLTGQNENVILTYTERLTVKGDGGPIRRWIPVAQGPWIRQQTSQFSIFKATQSGSAVGLYYTPQPPPPIFPDLIVHEEAESTSETAQLYGFYHWPISWNYQFEGSGGLGGPYQYNPPTSLPPVPALPIPPVLQGQI